MRWVGVLVMFAMSSVYFLLSIEVGGVLAGFGYTFGAMMLLLAILSMTGSRRYTK